MQRTISRRSIIKLSLLGCGLAPALNWFENSAHAAALTPLSPDDPQAKALGFVTDAKSVSTSAHPTFKPGQRCATCVQFQGKASDATAGCSIFTGHSVPAGGWCSVWAQKPGS